MAKSASQSQIAIIGTGLIGASIGHVLVRKPDRNYKVVGYDARRPIGKKAKKVGAIDKDVGSIRDAVKDASLIIIAAPVSAARGVMMDMAPYLRDGVVITDTCSSKADVMAWAEELLPKHVNFIGGHPMTGKTETGPEAASADLFEEVFWAVIPSTSADAAAIHVVNGIIEQAHAKTMYIDPAEHDMWAAAVSHMPLLVSVALFRTVRDSEGWDDASMMAGPGFLSSTRLASSDHIMSAGIVETNRDATLHWLRRMHEELGTVIKAVEVGGEVVEDLLKKTSFQRDMFLDNPRGRAPQSGPETPTVNDAMGTLLMGGAVYERLKELSKSGSPVVDEDELRRELGGRRNGDRN